MANKIHFVDLVKKKSSTFSNIHMRSEFKRCQQIHYDTKKKLSNNRLWSSFFFGFPMSCTFVCCVPHITIFKLWTPYIFHPVLILLFGSFFPVHRKLFFVYFWPKLFASHFNVNFHLALVFRIVIVRFAQIFTVEKWKMSRDRERERERKKHEKKKRKLLGFISSHGFLLQMRANLKWNILCIVRCYCCFSFVDLVYGFSFIALCLVWYERFYSCYSLFFVVVHFLFHIQYWCFTYSLVVFYFRFAGNG